MIKQISIKTKLGWISALEESGQIVKVKFGKIKNKSKSSNLKKFKKDVMDFANGKNRLFKTKYLIKGNYIQKKIWKELKKINFGKTKSYGDIAKKYKLSPRYIGKICGQNKLPLIIPCHRVIRSDGSLGGFSAPGGIFFKKKLLNFEKKLARFIH